MKSKTPAKPKVNSVLEKVNKLIENVDMKGKEKLREELNNLVSSLQQNEYNLQKLHENVPIGLYQTTPQGEFTFVNNWFAKISCFGPPIQTQT